MYEYDVFLLKDHEQQMIIGYWAVTPKKRRL